MAFQCISVPLTNSLALQGMFVKAVEQENEMVKRCQQLCVLFTNCSGPHIRPADQHGEDLWNLGTIRYSFLNIEVKGPLEKNNNKNPLLWAGSSVKLSGHVMRC